MKIFAPEYYRKFKCIADKCKNNCCIGWEIDIDNETLSFYKGKGDIMKNISLSPSPHFILGKNERCPFLDESNLCYIIKNFGKEHLCQICADHPRFRSYFDSREEIGIGLSCEAAAGIILDNDLSIIELTNNDNQSKFNPEEEEFFILRNKILELEVKDLVDYIPNITLSSLYDFLIKLERLNPIWEVYLNGLKGEEIPLKDVVIKDSKTAKRLLSYFIFRYFHEYSLEFCLTCTLIILSIGGDIYEVSRIFSCEIEYSDINLDLLAEFVAENKA